GYTEPTLDPVAMAETAADLSASLLLNPNRAARMVLQHSRDANQLSLQNLLTSIDSRTIKSAPVNGYEGTIQRGINTAVFRNMLGLATNRNASPDVSAITLAHIKNLQSWLNSQASSSKDNNWKSHYAYLSGLVTQMEKDPSSFETPPAPYTPPGAPIGSFDPTLGCEF
ncbi:MAG TPA: peptidase, partial [Bacteroidetes bacterium]|nr:peptidase [Bacteroidota bacterium]